MSKTAMLIGVSALGLMALTSGSALAGDRHHRGHGHPAPNWYPYHYAPYHDYYSYRYYPYPYDPYGNYSYDYRPYYSHHENEEEEEEEEEGER